MTTDEYKSKDFEYQELTQKIIGVLYHVYYERH